MRPRRWSWLLGSVDTANAWAEFTEGVDMQRVETIGIAGTYGGGTEDVVIVIAPGGLVLASQPWRMFVSELAPEKITFSGFQFTLLVAKQPKGVGILSGAGLAAPAGY
jgi:hypothetical protein